MKIIVIGTGYVGLVHAAVCSEFGFEVHGFDTDTRKVEDFSSGRAELIEKHVNEPGLFSIIRETLGKYLFFTSALEPIIEGADAIFLCLPTPPKLDGSTDLSIYKKSVRHLAGLLASRKDKRRVTVINKSTVPIGTARMLEDILKQGGAENVGVCSNPEFLAEGTAVAHARVPDRVVVGCDHTEDFKTLGRVYAQFKNHVRIKYIETTPETAEGIKYVANTMLLTYISFWNGVGAKLGEKIPNLDIDALRVGVTADDRISTWGSMVSNGAGGSCFGKDIRSLIYQMRGLGLETKMLESSYEVNEHQKVYLIDRAINEAGFNFNNTCMAVLGLAFKQNTSDMRDASSIEVIEALLSKGVRKIKVYDPLANDAAKAVFTSANNALFEKIEFLDSPKAAIEGTDALFISSDCDEFRGLAATIEQTVSPPYLVIDGRRMIPDYRDLVEAGYTYLAVGSTALLP